MCIRRQTSRPEGSRNKDAASNVYEQFSYKRKISGEHIKIELWMEKWADSIKPSRSNGSSSNSSSKQSPLVWARTCFQENINIYKLEEIIHFIFSIKVRFQEHLLFFVPYRHRDDAQIIARLRSQILHVHNHLLYKNYR